MKAVAFLAMALVAGGAAAFELVTPGRTATLCVPASEPECVRLAVADLAHDIRAITDRSPAVSATTGSVLVVTLDRAESAAVLNAVAPGFGNELAGRWEAYRVGLVGDRLILAGSDERGTMFAVYAFSERYLGVDPLYYWAARPPARRERLAWQAVSLSAGEPTFRYRGWMINDEDLLSEFKLDGGERQMAYRYYQHVISPEVSARIYEAALRLQMNLVIPSSFVDLRNPAEARLVQDAVRRGLFVTTHHVEPLGVSAFTFESYWKEKGRPVPYAYTKHADAFREVWRDYAQRWAAFGPQVVWQLGLRGVADQPVWRADPDAPATEAGRGQLISAAMADQWAIIRSVDARPRPPATTTLWMEGAGLNAAGHLKFPAGVGVVFSDNSPGWQWQRDFYDSPREPDRPYGVYYHQQLWNSGPHLVQAVPPWKTRDVLRQAVKRGATHYAMVNASNIREFVLGLDATARMLRAFPAFDPDAWLSAWCKAHFGGQAEAAEAAYRQLFASAVAGPDGKVAPLDGEWRKTGEAMAGELLARLEHGTRPSGKYAGAAASARAQRQRVEQAGAGADRIAAALEGADRAFFESNFMAQQKLMLGLLVWVEQAAGAEAALDAGDRAGAVRCIEATRKGVALMEAGKALASRGEFADWYRGDRKMNLAQFGEWTGKLTAAAGPGDQR